MKKFLSAIFTLSVLMAIQGCKKSDGSQNNNNNNKPQPTPIGAPTGTKTSKLIPKTGGSITSADGKLEIDFPNGALANDDTISIQPITNNCPGGIQLAYRLGPDGTKFNQPVTLKFHYDDSVLKLTLPGLMGVAFQDSSGTWNLMNSSSNDTVNHIISAAIQHFSDWTEMDEASIEPGQGSLKVNQKISLRVSQSIPDEQTYNTAQPLVTPDNGATITWSVNGVTNGNSQYGTITNGPYTNGNDYVIYTAPATAPPGNKNPVLIAAEIKGNFIDYSTKPYQHVNKIILYSRIYIFDGGYHVELSFEADSVNQSGGLWTLKDKGSFDVVLADGEGAVKNIQNSDISIGLISNGGTCNPSLVYAGAGTINIVDSSYVAVNPLLNNINIIFNSLDQKNYVKSPIFGMQCPGDTLQTSGGGLGPPFPGYIQFNQVDAIQTFIAGQYKIVVTPVK